MREWLLQHLRQCAPYRMPATVLIDAALLAFPGHGPNDVNAHLEALRAKGLVASDQDPVNDSRRWFAQPETPANG
jgi:hypothetical protein